MPAIKIVIFVLLALIISIFAVKNLDLVEVSFYDFGLNSVNVKVPLLIVILASLGLGFLLAWVESVFSKMKLKATIHSKQKTIDSLNREIAELKSKSLPELTEKNDP
ncbi:LapA family protein [Nitrospina sp. 32_T5]|uniref:LapA family protein n=1 Tax=unclassified Nitrospina TaxID=2638683 RepID=UPI003F9792E4